MFTLRRMHLSRAVTIKRLSKEMSHQSSRRAARLSCHWAIVGMPVATATFVQRKPVRRKPANLSLDALWRSRLRRTEICFESPAFKELYVDCYLG